MGKQRNKINMPKAPKSFGSWRDVYKVVSEGKIYPNSQSAWYMDDNCEMQKIEFNLLAQYVMQECSETRDKIIKLNEELTAENTRLLKILDTVDNLEKRIERQAKYYLEIVSHKDNVLSELNSIKSKWWYKLLTWKWN